MCLVYGYCVRCNTEGSLCVKTENFSLQLGFRNLLSAIKTIFISSSYLEFTSFLEVHMSQSSYFIYFFYILVFEFLLVSGGLVLCILCGETFVAHFVLVSAFFLT